MAKARKIKKKNGKHTYEVYEIIGKTENGNPKRLYGYGDTLKEAKADLKIKIDAYRRQGFQNLQQKMTVNELYDYWMENEVIGNLKENTIKGYQNCYKNHIKTSIGHMFLKDVNVMNIQNFITKRSSEISEHLMKNVHIVLGQMLRLAFDQGFIPNNPYLYIRKKKYKKDKGLDYELPDNETLKLIPTLFNPIDPEYISFYIALYTGARASEIFGLKWTDIDFKAHTISIERQINEIGGIHETDTKTPTSVRKIKVSGNLIKMLENYKENLNKFAELYGDAFCGGEYVCSTPKGELMRPSYVRRNIQKKLKPYNKEFRFHTLRHFYATKALEAGTNIKVVSNRLGHASVQVTLDRYVTMTQEMEDEAVDIFDTVLDNFFNQQ
ncbi:tyrosine-type recombinase/integrase [Thomasclavelia cocleata]|uniref:tyrosine-type recombinase/integrase n=1 Tax=Thomasclavelia cocleata TaxID=69824 RepID=UPI00242FF8E5|nr:site-specific integrase [Thomasclavelia cocleata]